MAQSIYIPLFPLNLLPLPGELVPLHIFEPRYKQLFREAEAADFEFGIYFTHPSNNAGVGAVMQLESILKRYPEGELDVVVKCRDIFTMEKQYRNYVGKLYPAAHIYRWHMQAGSYCNDDLLNLFAEYVSLRKYKSIYDDVNLFTIAHELNLELAERYKLLMLDEKKRAPYLLTRVQYHVKLLRREAQSKNVFHLN